MANNLFCSVYQKSFSESMRHNELPIWRDSFRINVACKEAIELAIQEGFDGKYLAEDCARRVLDTYGFKRIGYVLANTLQEKSDDGRFSLENKARAALSSSRPIASITASLWWTAIPLC